MPPKLRRTQTIDGFRPLPRRPSVLHVPPRPVDPPPAAAAPPLQPRPQPVAPQPTPPPTVMPEPSAQQKSRFWRGKLQWAIIIAAGVVIGLIVQAVPLGYLGVGVYGIVAIMKHIPSRITFLLALGALSLAPMGIVIGNGAVANGFSLIGFLLLSVGVVTLGIELNRERRSAHTEHGTGH
jgi:hypothetical protein